MEKQIRRGRPRHPEQVEEQRHRLLRAAVIAFGETGFSGTTVAGVAERAGLSTGLVHHYFASKAGLFTETVEYGAEYLRHVRGAAREGRTPQERLRRWAGGFTLALERAHLMFLLVNQVLGAPKLHPPGAMEALNRFEREEIALLRQWLEEAGHPPADAERRSWLAFYCIGGARLIGSAGSPRLRSWLYQEACSILGIPATLPADPVPLPPVPWSEAK